MELTMFGSSSGLRSASQWLFVLLLAAWFSGDGVAGSAAAAQAAPECRRAAGDGDRPAPAKRYRNTLKWATASEVDNFAYDVYRAEQEDGPFARINERPVPGAGSTDEPSYYQYTDDTVEPGKRYFYYVESIAMNGDRERFTPVYSAPVKSPGDVSDDSAGCADPQRTGVKED